MGWARLDDRWHDHPKVIEAGLEGAGLYTMCLTWAHSDHARAKANGQAPGVVPDGVIARFAGPKAKRLARRLREVGLFDEHTGTGWPIHDYAMFLPRYDSEQAREAGAAGGRARAAKRSGRRTASEPLGEPPPVPLDEPLPDDEQTASGSHVRADAGASARRNPDPEPEPEPTDGASAPSGRGSSSRGVTSGTRGGPPPPRCPRHLEHPAEGPCGPCGDARRTRETFDREQQQRLRDAGPVVGGLHCTDHPTEPAGQCGRCAAAAVPMPDAVRDELRRRRAS